MSQKQLPSQYPVFNQKYNIVKSLGEGHTSKVYLAHQIGNPSIQVAIKVLKEEFLTKEKDAIKSVENEITILRSLKHTGIINILECGDSGVVEKPSGRIINRFTADTEMLDNVSAASTETRNHPIRLLALCDDGDGGDGNDGNDGNGGGDQHVEGLAPAARRSSFRI